MKRLIFGILLLLVVGCIAQDDDTADAEPVTDAPPPPPPPPPEEEIIEEEPEPTEPPYVDPCINVTCPRMQYCEDDDRDGKGECVCNQRCDPVPDRVRYMVCSNQNETFPSECALERSRCLCQKGHADCKKSNRKNAELKHYGPCGPKPECTDEDMDTFMSRLFRWYPRALYNRVRYGRLSRPEMYFASRVARMRDLERQYAEAGQWYFCYLDSDDDGKVSREESSLLTSQLHPLEACGTKFITNCDADSDKSITFSEWQKCLGLEGDELRDVCADLAKQIQSQRAGGAGAGGGGATTGNGDGN